MSAMGGSEGIQCLRGGFPQRGEGALGALPQERLEFGKGQLDRVEVRAVSGQIKQLGSTVFNGFAHSADFVRGKIVANDEVAAVQFGREDFLHVSQKHGPVHRAIEQQRRGEAVVAQGGDEGERAPMAVRHAAQAALGGVGTPVKSRHLGVEAGFIKEDEPGDRPAGLPALPLLAGQCDVGPVLFRGAQRFFYSSSRGAQDGATGR